MFALPLNDRNVQCHRYTMQRHIFISVFYFQVEVTHSGQCYIDVTLAPVCFFIHSRLAALKNEFDNLYLYKYLTCAFNVRLYGNMIRLEIRDCPLISRLK